MEHKSTVPNDMSMVGDMNLIFGVRILNNNFHEGLKKLYEDDFSQHRKAKGLYLWSVMGTYEKSRDTLACSHALLA